MRLEFAQSFQNVGKRVGSMCIVDEYLKLSLCGNQFQTSRDLRRFPKAQDRVSQINSQRLRGGERSDGIGDVEAPN